jgi:hypothetical protein
MVCPKISVTNRLALRDAQVFRSNVKMVTATLVNFPSPCMRLLAQLTDGVKPLVATENGADKLHPADATIVATCEGRFPLQLRMLGTLRRFQFNTECPMGTDLAESARRVKNAPIPFPIIVVDIGVAIRAIGVVIMPSGVIP